MLKKIFKFSIGTIENKITMPEGAQILSCDFQDDDLVVWALVDVERTKEEAVIFDCVFTGQACNHIKIAKRKPYAVASKSTHEFIGTATNRFGIVVHVFKVIETE